jgi:hypothetical protein
VESIKIRLHRTVLYNSIYRADDQFLVNQHTYGIPAAQAPVFCLCDAGGGEMAGSCVAQQRGGTVAGPGHRWAQWRGP